MKKGRNWGRRRKAVVVNDDKWDDARILNKQPFSDFSIPWQKGGAGVTSENYYMSIAEI